MRTPSRRDRPTEHDPAPTNWTGPADLAGTDAAHRTRRDALRLVGTASALLALATGRPGSVAGAQQATPGAGTQEATPSAVGATEGRYAVLRTRRLKSTASVDELNVAIRDGFVPIIRRIPGFVEYYIVQNFETRERTSVSIFVDKAGTDASTQQAGEFLRGQGLADYYEDVDPVVQEGDVVLSAVAEG